MTNSDSIIFRHQIDAIILNLKAIQQLIDHIGNLGNKYQFDKDQELEFHSIFNILKKQYLDVKLEQFFQNIENAGFIYNFDEQFEILTTNEEYVNLFVTQDNFDNFSWKNEYSLSSLIIKLSFIDRLLETLYIKYSNLEEKLNESNFDLIQEDFIELRKAIRSFITVLRTSSFISQEIRDLMTLVFWNEVL